MYLRQGGRFSLVMPHGTLTRQPHDGFRSGQWGSLTYGPLNIVFARSWDLSKATTGFPMVSCVIHGTRANTPSRMPAEVSLWKLRLTSPNVSLSDLGERLTISEGKLAAQSKASMPEPSPYKKRFRQGAVLAPLVLLFVTDAPSGPLGAGAGRVSLQSLRTNLEKKPWKDVESLRGTVERSFVRDVYLGETVLPFRLQEPRRAVLPVRDSSVLSSDEIEQYEALRQWWAVAEGQWAKHKAEGDSSDLLHRIDFHGQLSSQVPASKHRVVYTKAGTTLAAARVTDDRAIIDFGLYWSAASSEEEALYLTAILNSASLLERVRPLQTLGLFGARHFDKYVFAVPIPTFDGKNPEHTGLVELARAAETSAREVDLSGTRNFKTARSLVRSHIDTSLTAIDERVLSLIQPVVDDVAVAESNLEVGGDK